MYGIKVYCHGILIIYLWVLQLFTLREQQSKSRHSSGSTEDSKLIKDSQNIDVKEHLPKVRTIFTSTTVSDKYRAKIGCQTHNKFVLAISQIVYIGKQITSYVMVTIHFLGGMSHTFIHCSLQH